VGQGRQRRGGSVWLGRGPNARLGRFGPPGPFPIFDFFFIFHFSFFLFCFSYFFYTICKNASNQFKLLSEIF
jgi:hypothetical protein